MTVRFRSREPIGWLIVAAGLGLAGSVCAQTAATPKAPVQPVPNYVIVQAEHADDASTVQWVTAQCPQGLRVLGAGFSAVIRNAPDKAPPTGGAARPAYHEEGLENVRSFPNAAGTGWQVSGVSPGALGSKQPWHLVVRAVCLRVAP